MAYQIIRKKRFVNQLLKLLTYLEENWGLQTAVKFQENVEAHFKLLEQHPYLGKPTSKLSARSILITPHNRVVYKIAANKIIVLAMYDTRTNPKRNKY